jgi:hypothetical protein
VKVYASDTTYDTYNEAKAACAEAALREGVLDFIKHGNGQSHPASPQPFLPRVSSDFNSVSASKQPPLTLQAFYESLPRPFPESFESKDANGIGAPGYMNTLVQNARGGKVIMTFIFTSDGTPGCTSFHCVLVIALMIHSSTWLFSSVGPTWGVQSVSR